MITADELEQTIADLEKYLPTLTGEQAEKVRAAIAVHKQTLQGLRDGSITAIYVTQGIPKKVVREDQ